VGWGVFGGGGRAGRHLLYCPTSTAGNAICIGSRLHQGLCAVAGTWCPLHSLRSQHTDSQTAAAGGSDGHTYSMSDVLLIATRLQQVAYLP